MSQIMNHREIEYFTNKYWKNHGQELSMIKDMVSGECAFTNLMDWLENTQKVVLQEDLDMDYGLDCIRCYLLFEKTPKADDPYFDTWDEGGLEGVYKFVSKYRRMIYTALEANRKGVYADTDVTKLIAETEKAKRDCLVMMRKENTMPNRHNVLSILMECLKQIQKELKIGEITVKEHAHEIEMAIPLQEQVKQSAEAEDTVENRELYELCKKLVIMMTPFVPYISEELWQMIQIYETGDTEVVKKWYDREQKSTSVLQQKWTAESTETDFTQNIMQIPVQVNARTRRTIQITTAMTEEQVEELARKEVQRFLRPDIQYRIVYVPHKLINFVALES